MDKIDHTQKIISMHQAFFYEGQTIVDALVEAREKIAAIDNPDFTAKRNQILHQLTGMINPVRVTQMGLQPEVYLTGIGEDEGPVTKIQDMPITKMFGVDLTKAKEAVDPFKTDVDELIRQIDALEHHFLTLTDDMVLDSYPDIVIRGLGKRLDFPYTDNSPKMLKTADLKAMREKLIQRNEIQSKTENES